MMDVNNTLVVVTRWYGGVHLGGDRWKHINNAARSAIEGAIDQEKSFVNQGSTKCKPNARNKNTKDKKH